ncbi:MAG: protein phosphatase 2C domain-containing protein [Actinomycetota bacterium]|nr:protein phosphatase 2C domain-containing protein [Actinomycetota bacterium]
MTLALRYAVRSDVGLLREGNEDAAYAGPRLLAVADGMGGYEAGEVASSSVISSMAPLDRRPVPDTDAGLIDALAEAMSTAKRALREIADADPSVSSMGTTLTAMLWSGSTAAICHIGDSRAYLLRQGSLYQVTRDHTFVQSLVDEGRIRPEEAATHPQRSLLLRALDGRNDADPDLSLLAAEEGDRILLCSDGLPVAASDAEIGQILADIAEPADAVLQLIDLAIRGGGPDNITCIVADVIDPAMSAVPPSRAPVVVGAAATEPQIRQDTRPIPVSHGFGGGSPPESLLDDVDEPPDGPRAEEPPAGYDRPGPKRKAARATGQTQSAVRAPGRAADIDDNAAQPGNIPTRRRWPIMSTVLALFVLLLGIGVLGGYQYIRSQYFVGASGGTVVIYRGINEHVLGLSLSSVAQRTSIPVAAIPRADALVVQAAVGGSLAEAQRIVANVRRDYLACQNAYTALRQWVAGKPKPRIVRTKVNGKIVTKTVTPPYHKPKPVIPSDCPPEPAHAS